MINTHPKKTSSHSQVAKKLSLILSCITFPLNSKTIWKQYRGSVKLLKHACIEFNVFLRLSKFSFIYDSIQVLNKQLVLHQVDDEVKIKDFPFFFFTNKLYRFSHLAFLTSVWDCSFCSHIKEKNIFYKIWLLIKTVVV